MQSRTRQKPIPARRERKMGKSRYGARRGLGRGDGNRADTRVQAAGSRLQPASISLSGAKAASEEPGKRETSGRYGLVGERTGGETNPAACITQAVEEVLVFTAAASELRSKPQAFACDCRSPYQDIARVARFDPSTDKNRTRRMEIALAHPGRSRWRVKRLHGTENGIPLSALGLAEETDQPTRRGSFVIIEEGEPLPFGRIEAGIAGDGDVICRRMHIDRIECQVARRRGDQIARDGLLGVVRNDNADLYAVAPLLTRNRSQGLDDRRSMIRADANIDGRNRERAGLSPGTGFGDAQACCPPCPL